MKIRWVSVAALAALTVAVLLTVLDGEHLGVLDGPLPRIAHALAFFGGTLGVGWTLGALRNRKAG